MYDDILNYGTYIFQWSFRHTPGHTFLQNLSRAHSTPKLNYTYIEFQIQINNIFKIWLGGQMRP